MKTGEWCDNKVSLNEYIYRKYINLMVTIVKGFSLMLKSYESLAEVTHGTPIISCINNIYWFIGTDGNTFFVSDDYDDTIDVIQQKYYAFKRSFGDIVMQVMAQSSAAIRRCDQPEHERGNRSYSKISRTNRHFDTFDFYRVSFLIIILLIFFRSNLSRIWEVDTRISGPWIQLDTYQNFKWNMRRTPKCNILRPPWFHI